MEFETVVHARHSVRDFRDEQVPHEVLEDIVRMAQRTPTWANSQPVRVYIVSGDAAVRLRAEHAQRVESHEESHSDIAAMPRSQWPQWNQEVMGQWTVEFK